MKKYWDSIEVGHMVLENAKPPISRLQIAQFAAATDDFSPLNLDEEFAKNSGFNSVYVPGLMSLGFVEEALRAYAKNMAILSLHGTFQRLIWPNDSLTVSGIVLRRYKKHEDHKIQFSLWCENQNKDVVLKGSSICLLFKNPAHEHESKTLLPPISHASHQAFREKCAHLIRSSRSEKVSGRKELA